MREELGKARTFEEFYDITNRLKELRINESPESKIGWYQRYIPKEDILYYNDYRLSLRQTISIEESKDNFEAEKKVAVVNVVEEKQQDMDLGGMFE